MIMIAGLVALFVMISVYGIIRLAQNALGVGTETTIGVPLPPGAGGPPGPGYYTPNYGN